MTLRLLVALALGLAAHASLAGDGFQITGRSGVMHFVAIDVDQKDNEDIYRFAVAEACAGRSICQVQFWVGSAPAGFPLSEDQIESKLVQWQLNLNTGLRRWLVKCGETDLFVIDRECM
jgi:hypothetical protein